MKEISNNKKKKATIIGVAALPFAVAFSINQSFSDNGTMDVNLANIQALAKGEGDSGFICVYSNGTCEYDGVVMQGTLTFF